jgi:tRNA 2-thiouridine synthesizing protein A
MTTILDTKGLSCPLPVLKAKKAIKRIADDETLTVLATDPSSVQDFHVFCETTGYQLVESGEDDGIYRFVIKKTG